MNYIQHLTGFLNKLSSDDRPNPTHISLYLALFQLWNANRFENPISVDRSSTMRLSKIGSLQTYHKCINDLSTWGYILYCPSHNPIKGSLVHMCNFGTSTVQPGTDTYPISEQASVHRCYENGTSGVQALYPSINNINSINNKTNNSEENTRQKKSTFENIKFENIKTAETSLTSSPKNRRKKVAPKKETITALPFSSPQFIENWNTLTSMPKWKNKQLQSLKMALNKLSKYEEEFAIHLMELAITNGWQGVVFLDTDAKYKQWIQNKYNNGHTTINAHPAPARADAPEIIQPERNYKERF